MNAFLRRLFSFCVPGHRGAISFCAIALACLAASTAFAQSKTIKEELPENLRSTWEAAGDLFEDGNYEAALVQYQSIYKESKNPRVLYNVGVCFKELKKYVQAVGAWEKQLASKDKLPEKEVKRAEAALETVRPFVTTIEVESNQADAVLLIGGEEVGKTPFLAPVAVATGSSTLRLVKEGYAPVERTIDIPKSKTAKVTLNMVKADKTAPAEITVTGAGGAIIFIDGIDMGPAPFKGEVPIGRHTFTARKRGFLQARQTSNVVLGEPLKVTLSLVKSRKEGKIRIRTDHPEAVISIDGKVKGSGTWEGLLSEGGHELEVTLDGYETHTADVSLAPNQERVIKVVLKEDKTAAWIYWAVTGVLVAAGAGVTSYFVLRPAEESEVSGTIDPFVLPTVWKF